VSGVYIGADRRQPVAARTYPLVQRRLVTWSAVAIVGWLVVIALTARYWPWMQAQLADDARGCAAALFLCAGAMRMARWRLTGEAAVAFWAAALIVLGGSNTMLRFLGPDLQSSDRMVDAPVIMVVIVAPVFGLLIAGFCTTPVRAGLRPLLLAAACIAGCTSVLILLAASRTATSAAMTQPVVWALAECAAAGSWAAIGGWAWSRSHSRAKITGYWSACGLYLMAAAGALRALSLIVPGSLFASATGLEVVAAAIAMTASAIDLSGAYAEQGMRALLLSGGLHQAQRQLHTVQQDHRERLHDARSAVVGVIGASSLLTGAAADEVAARLHRMMADELTRLDQVLDPDGLDPIEEFYLDEVLASVLLAHRLAGGRVLPEPLRVAVLGRRRSTATVVANLLANVRAHAPAATVTLQLCEAAGTVTLLVDDDGPGIPVAQRARLLQRGERGRGVQVPGSGLGLYTAMMAMAGQDGALELGESPAGGLRVAIRLQAPALGPWNLINQAS
jgi:signal transduction histidine kinase